MCKFVQVIYNSNYSLYSNLHYIPDIRACYRKYAKYLQDDFSDYKDNITPYIESFFPFFWVILNKDNAFMGFVGLDNLIGSKNRIYSADLTTCFEKRAWGDFTRYSAKFFLKSCFEEFGLSKLRTLVYPDNFRTSSLLKYCGFKLESVLKNDTLRNGKMQDINIYSLYRSYYLKNEVNYDRRNKSTSRLKRY